MAHHMSVQSKQVHDAARDFWLREHGWHILRLPNDIVIGGGNIVLARITTAIETAMALNNV